MGDASRQGADGFELLRLAQLRLPAVLGGFGFFEIGDIREHGDTRDDASLAIAHRGGIGEDPSGLAIRPANHQFHVGGGFPMGDRARQGQILEGDGFAIGLEDLALAGMLGHGHIEDRLLAGAEDIQGGGISEPEPDIGGVGNEEAGGGLFHRRQQQGLQARHFIFELFALGDVEKRHGHPAGPFVRVKRAGAEQNMESPAILVAQAGFHQAQGVAAGGVVKLAAHPFEVRVRFVDEAGGLPQ